MIRCSVKALDYGHRVALHHHHARRCAVNARQTGQVQGQYFATGDSTRVPHAGKLAQTQSAIGILQRALGAHAPQGRGLALQIGQICAGLLAQLHGAGRAQNFFQLQKCRRGALALGHAAQILPLFATQAQCADAAEIIHRSQVIQLRQWTQGCVLGACFGMRARNHTAAPGVGLCVGQRCEKATVLAGGRLEQLVAHNPAQIRRHIKVACMRQPRWVVGKLRKLALPVFHKNELAHRVFGLAQKNIQSPAHRTHFEGITRSHQNAPDSGVVRGLRTRWGSCASIKTKPMVSCGVSSNWSSCASSPKTCMARAR